MNPRTRKWMRLALYYAEEALTAGLLVVVILGLLTLEWWIGKV